MRSSIVRSLLVFSIWLLPLATAPAPLSAQVGRAALGGAVGLGAGLGITMATVVARARFQSEYLEAVNDLIHWQSAPILLAPAVGGVFGWASEDALRGSVTYGVGGMLAGAAAGAAIGWLASEYPEGPWAGGVIGGGLGLAVGGIVGGLTGWSDDPDADLDLPGALRFGVRVPVR